MSETGYGQQYFSGKAKATAAKLAGLLPADGPLPVVTRVTTGTNLGDQIMKILRQHFVTHRKEAEAEAKRRGFLLEQLATVAICEVLLCGKLKQDAAD